MPITSLRLSKRLNISQIRCLIQAEEAQESSWIKQLSDAELEEELIQISHTKRFLERWQADPNFRQQVLMSPSRAVARYNLSVDPEIIKPLWDESVVSSNGEEPVNSAVKRFQDFNTQKRSSLPQIAASSSELRFKAWRERQIARSSSQMSKSLHDQILHFPVCFELSKGCSVGCPFCSVSAPRLGDIFTYNQENAKLWREVLALLQNIHGDAAKAGFCYWATDPLDNPDYEKFCLDFHEILGVFPQTTTAQALKNPQRTRSLLKLALERGCMANRFSILSLKMLDQLHQEFTPEELAFVRLVLQNPEAGIIKANSGRARQQNKKKVEKNQQLDDSLPGTNACVSGFLFNMVERSVKLISPCNANDKWSSGYRIYEEGIFADINDLKILLEGMIERQMPLTVRTNDRIGFRPDLKYESLPDGFQVSTRYKIQTFRNDSYLKPLGEIVYQANKTVQEIVSVFNICGISPTHVFNSINLMFKHGILDDEPQL